MKLYEVPRNTRIRVVAPSGNKWLELNFDHIDGMYSYCTTDDGDVVHLASWVEVEIV